jgi:hypothetical protein
MQPAIDLADLNESLTERFKDRYESDPPAHTRMVGIAFARPHSPLSKAEIIPQLNDWHYRSGNHIDFYFAGYTYHHPLVPGYIEVPIPGGEPWLYSAERFNAFRQEIESSTTWQYGGSCELLLTNARFDAKSKRGYLDFSSMICCQLDEMKNDQAIQSVERFFESVFRFADSTNDEDPTWGFSDAQGIGIAGSALKRVVLSLLPKSLEEDYKKAEHFAVRDVGRA